MTEGWQREFDEPIVAPDGTLLRTLREAVAYLAKTVPKAERDLPAVTTAAEMLTYAAACVGSISKLARSTSISAPTFIIKSAG